MAERDTERFRNPSALNSHAAAVDDSGLSDKLDGGNELALSGFENQHRGFRPFLRIEAITVARIEHPLDHWPRHLRETRDEVMLAH